MVGILISSYYKINAMSATVASGIGDAIYFLNGNFHTYVEKGEHYDTPKDIKQVQYLIK